MGFLKSGYSLFQCRRGRTLDFVTKDIALSTWVTRSDGIDSAAHLLTLVSLEGTRLSVGRELSWTSASLVRERQVN